MPDDGDKKVEAKEGEVKGDAAKGDEAKGDETKGDATRREPVVVRGYWRNGNLVAQNGSSDSYAFVYVRTEDGRYCLLKQNEAGFPNSTNSKLFTMT